MVDNYQRSRKQKAKSLYVNTDIWCQKFTKSRCLTTVLTSTTVMVLVIMMALVRSSVW